MGIKKKKKSKAEENAISWSFKSKKKKKPNSGKNGRLPIPVLATKINSTIIHPLLTPNI